MGKATPDLKRKDYAQKEILIEAKNLKQYFRVRSDYTIRAVDDVSFGIREGEIMALVGETGCGKSTTARTLAGIYHPTGGELFYRGEKLSDKKSPFGLRQTGDNDIRKRMAGRNPDDFSGFWCGFKSKNEHPADHAGTDKDQPKDQGSGASGK